MFRLSAVHCENCQVRKSAAKCKQIPKEIKHKIKRKVRLANGNRARLIAVGVLIAQMHPEELTAPSPLPPPRTENSSRRKQ